MALHQWIVLQHGAAQGLASLKAIPVQSPKQHLVKIPSPRLGSTNGPEVCHAISQVSAAARRLLE